MTESIPVANISTNAQVNARRWRTRLWWLTAICLVMAVGITAASLRTTGDSIVIHFRDGHGIKTGDTLRYLGIDLGSVTEVHLASDRRSIDVHIQLMPEHKSIAVEGSRFWIERPRLRIGQVSGLETVIGAKYVGTIPGKVDSPVQHEFTGLDAPLGFAESDSLDIEVRFPAGEGLSVGDPVRYLGIDVGEVTLVELSDRLDAVRVGVRLVGAAQSLARAGTQFWIERPRVDISEVRGLETLVGGRYLAIEPSPGVAEPGEAEPAAEFVGLPQAPPLARREGSLELELEARQRHGLVRSAPVTYRGLEIGRVADVRLASDGASVTVGVIIEPEYADLVRHNSVWWSSGGVRVDASLTGVNMSVDSFASWLRGGISLATPQPPGNKVATGHRFGLADKADPDWPAWQPRIATGPWATSTSGQLPMPRVVRAAISWQSSFLGFTRRQSAQTWCLPLDDDRICVPAGLIQAARAAGGPVKLEIAGSSQDFNLANVTDQDGICYLPLPAGVEVEKWNSRRTAGQPWNGKTTLLVINPELAEPMPLDASRAAPAASGVIEVNRAVAIHKSLEGSAVIEATTGELLGLLVSLKNRWEIRPVK